MRRTLLLVLFLAFAQAQCLRAQSQAKPAPATPPSAAATAPAGDTLAMRVENYLRNYYAWGSDFDVKAGPEKPSPIPDLIEMPVTVSKGGAADTATVYVSKDGKFIFRGDLTDMTVNPFQETREKLHAEGWPSEGPADAKVVLVEYADFECPSCKALDMILRDILPKYPDVRLVYKYFPLTSIHPWAMNAALAGQCVFKQSPTAFWKFHDAVYDQQDDINKDNVQDKLEGIAQQAGIDIAKYGSCTTDPATAAQVDQSIAEARMLNVDSTPTIFVNGRRIDGASQMLLEQFIQYESGHN